jgi:hypothetical protein
MCPAIHEAKGDVELTSDGISSRSNRHSLRVQPRARNTSTELPVREGWDAASLDQQVGARRSNGPANPLVQRDSGFEVAEPFPEDSNVASLTSRHSRPEGLRLAGDFEHQVGKARGGRIGKGSPRSHAYILGWAQLKFHFNEPIGQKPRSFSDFAKHFPGGPDPFDASVIHVKGNGDLGESVNGIVDAPDQ